MVTGLIGNRFQGKKRPFIVFAPSEEDDRFDGQMLCLNDYKEGFIERDLVMVEVLGEGESRAGGEPLSEVEVDSLRKQYGAGPDEFLAVLVGKDGIEKAHWHDPIPPDALFRAADEIEEEGVSELNR